MAISLILKSLGTEAVSLIELIHVPKGEEEKQKKEGESSARISDRKTSKKVAQAEEEEEIVFEILQSDEVSLKKYEQKRIVITKLVKNEIEESPTPQLFRDPIFF